MKEISIIIPTYNEEKTIETAIRKIENKIKSNRLKAEIVVVDDSNDKTYKILKKLQTKYKNLNVLHRYNERGVGSAIIGGIELAKGKFIIIFMSDAPNDAKYFPRIIKKLREGYDVVHASRFINGSSIKNYTPMKLLANRLCNNFCRIVFLRPDLKDFSHLYKGFRKSIIKSMNLESNDFDIGIEISLKALKRGMKVGEVPVSWAERESGETKWHMSNLALKYFLRTMKVWLTY